MNRLTGLCKLIAIATTDGGDPPTAMPDLVTWLEAHASRDEKLINYSGKMAVDAWGNPVVLLTLEGALYAIGSCGPNARWDGGSGDDIVAKVSGANIIYPRLPK